MLEYINNPNVAIINVLSDDPNVTWDCSEWGMYGIDDFPIILDDLDFIIEADLNQDEGIDIVDVILLINVILGIE